MITPEYVNWVRRAEMEKVTPLLRPGMRMLEVGAGSGQQALLFHEYGLQVEAIDLPSSNYADVRVCPVTDYDGKTFPFVDSSFDLVFSSNTLEHIRDLDTIHAESKRVLKPDGFCIHIVPTGWWQFWSIVSGFAMAGAAFASVRNLSGLAIATRRTARAFVPPRHGERGTALLEIWLFRPQWWRKEFRRGGFEIIRELPVGLFYTGNAFRGFAWDKKRRQQLARRLGSASHLFLIKPST